jgi:predicted NAD/FAD-binding protein
VATALAESGQSEALAEPLGEFLDREGFGSSFREGYLLPMIACIWSCPQDQMLNFPIASLVRFCHNHGLLQVENRPAWHTVAGGSRHYVQAIVQQLEDARAATPVSRVQRKASGVVVHTPSGSETFDAVVFACHAPQALAMLGDDADAEEHAIMGVMRTQRNTAVLHTDSRLMPKASKAWAAWNFERARDQQVQSGDGNRVCLHYWINKLQPLPFADPVIVSLNPLREPDAELTLGRYEWEHPVFDAAAIAAQSQLSGLQGQRRSWYCGAWCGYGFHEDGLTAGLSAARSLVAAFDRAELQEDAGRTPGLHARKAA